MQGELFCFAEVVFGWALEGGVFCFWGVYGEMRVEGCFWVDGRQGRVWII